MDRPFDLWDPCRDLRLGPRPVQIVLDPILHGPVNQNDSKLFMGDAVQRALGVTEIESYHDLWAERGGV